MNTTTHHNQPCIMVCNRLLRAELAAVETYRQTIRKFSPAPEMAELSRILGEHSSSAAKLRVNVVEMGGEPDTSSGARGAFARTIQGGANLLGEDSALSALEQGEKHCREDYLDALGDEEVMIECKQLIRSALLPAVEEHIAALKRLSSKQG